MSVIHIQLTTGRLAGIYTHVDDMEQCVRQCCCSPLRFFLYEQACTTVRMTQDNATLHRIGLANVAAFERETADISALANSNK